MKKLLLALCVAMMMAACAEEKTFRKSDGTTFTVQPYGWMNQSKKVDGVKYDICVGNMVLSGIFIETAAVPVLLTGLQLYEPVNYIEPTTK